VCVALEGGNVACIQVGPVLEAVESIGSEFWV